MRNVAAIVLAAGKGTRMKSVLPKVLHPVAGKPMLYHPLRLLERLRSERTVVVVGYGKDEVKAAFPGVPSNVVFVTQGEQRGTGHAVLCAMKALKGFKGDVLILSGDVPLITEETLKGLLRVHRRGGARRPAVSVMTAMLDDPKGYGRVVRDPGGAVQRIVEDRDAAPKEKEIREVNTGIYLMTSEFLSRNIGRLRTDNAQKEYYLPDLVRLAVKKGLRAAALTHIFPDEVMGVNNRVELARANLLMRRRIIMGLMESGVTFLDPDSTYIDAGVYIGPDTTIYPGVRISGDTVIGRGCVVEDGSVIDGSRIGEGATIKSYSVIEKSSIGDKASIGPFARLRPGNAIGKGSRVGNFVEVKNSRVGKDTRANHLAYLGDSVIGDGVNIGAGAITCNYDGIRKYTTTIEDGAFIGSDSQLVAPVTIGRNAYVGSGTTVTKDVPPGALVITRAPERVVEGWAEKKGLIKKKRR